MGFAASMPRVWISSGDGLARVGVCASVAAGAVTSGAGQARVSEVAVIRGLFTTASDDIAGIHTAHGDYSFVASEGEAPEQLYLAVHKQMTAVESRLAGNVDSELTVFDGPLRGRNDPLAVGYIKTQHVQYLPSDLQPTLGRLAAGQRTPLFAIGDRGERLSWYLRLPGPLTQPLAGVVRCEVVGTSSLVAATRADAITTTLARFASEPHKDPRAPQNLYPIAGLEAVLKHRLGDAQLLERALRRAAHGT